MVSLDKAVIARLKTHGENFEILVDPELALDYKRGKDIKLSEILAVETVFKDSSAADKASDESLKKIFGSTDVSVVADKILKKGELQLTTEQRKAMLEAKRKQIVAIIARNAINPQTGAPHPPARIEKAMEEARVHVDLSKTAEEQVDDVVKQIRPLLPIRFATVKIAVKIPQEYAGKIYSLFQEFGGAKQEEWAGSNLICMLEMPAGLQDTFYNKINNFTHGSAEIKIIEKNVQG